MIQTRNRWLTPLALASVVFIFESQARSAFVVVPFDTPGSAPAQTAPFGISLFVSNSYFETQGIHFQFTGNANAPIGPPSALSLGPTPGPATYFHFSPLPGFDIFSIGISATGAFFDQSTTFRVFAADESLASTQFDVTMTPTTSGIAGLNGGAVFLGVQSSSPITAFRVWQLDDGYGILDNLVADVRPEQQASNVPEATSLLVWGLLGLSTSAGAWYRCVRCRNPVQRVDKEQ